MDGTYVDNIASESSNSTKSTNIRKGFTEVDTTTTTSTRKMKSKLAEAEAEESVSSLCYVIDMKIYLQSGYNAAFLMSSRNDVETLKNNDYICNEGIGSNIEVIVNDECDLQQLNDNGGISIRLKQLDTNELSNSDNYYTVRNNITISPYFLYDNNIEDDEPNTDANDNADNTAEYNLFNEIEINDIKGGNALPIGSYETIAYPTNNPIDGLYQLNFEMITCIYFTPKNECNDCGQGGSKTTCEGSQCVSTSPNGIRLTLLSYGQDTFDLGVIITSPLLGLTMYEDVKQTTSDYDEIIDTTEGGYVDYNYIDHSCRSTGVWIKNILFPKYIPGIYTISFHDILKCTFMANAFDMMDNASNNGPPPFMSGPPPFMGGPPPFMSAEQPEQPSKPKSYNNNHYILKVYKNEELITIINDIISGSNNENNILNMIEYDEDNVADTTRGRILTFEL